MNCECGSQLEMFYSDCGKYINFKCPNCDYELVQSKRLWPDRIEIDKIKEGTEYV